MDSGISYHKKHGLRLFGSLLEGVWKPHRLIFIISAPSAKKANHAFVLCTRRRRPQTTSSKTSFASSDKLNGPFLSTSQWVHKKNGGGGGGGKKKKN